MNDLKLKIVMNKFRKRHIPGELKFQKFGLPVCICMENIWYVTYVMYRKKSRHFHSF